MKEKGIVQVGDLTAVVTQDIAGQRRVLHVKHPYYGDPAKGKTWIVDYWRHKGVPFTVALAVAHALGRKRTPREALGGLSAFRYGVRPQLRSTIGQMVSGAKRGGTRRIKDWEWTEVVMWKELWPNLEAVKHWTPRRKGD